MRALVSSLLGLTLPFTSTIAFNSARVTSRQLHRAIFIPLTFLLSSPISIGAVKTNSDYMEVDSEYPGTAVMRMLAVRDRARNLTQAQLNGDWEEVRRHILWAGGLRDLTNVPPGKGYTGHSFNDYNHCDLTTMIDSSTYNENDGKVPGIAFSNQLGPGIRTASIGPPELPAGGSWSTCMIGCARVPPRDVAHVQFRSRIAFKLVWCPPLFETFVLVDDAGKLLNAGTPTGALPHIAERSENYRVVFGSKYAVEAERVGRDGYEQAKQQQDVSGGGKAERRDL